MTKQMRTTLLCILTMWLISSQTSMAQDSLSLDKSIKREIIDSITTVLNKSYVFEEIAMQIEKKLRKELKDGGYKEFNTLDSFTNQLTEDCFSISNDQHIWIAPINDSNQPTDTLSLEERTALILEMDRSSNFGFNKVERLSSNIGYLELRGFYELSNSSATAIATMNFLANSDGLIIDLRNNGGGDPLMVQFLCSYFFDEPTHLNTFEIREKGTEQQFWTLPVVQGPKLSNIPIVILTNNNTFSAAEEFAFNLKNLGRAKIIGEQTGGGAHHNRIEEFRNLNIHMSLPFARAVNPITGTNWEGVGVTPNITVEADKALQYGKIEILRHLDTTLTSNRKLVVVRWELKDLVSSMNPTILDSLSLGRYTGTFGPRKVTLMDGILHYQRDSGVVHQLIPLGDNLFNMHDLDFFRMQFIADSTNNFNEIIGIYKGGRTDNNVRTK